MTCPKCTNSDDRMIEVLVKSKKLIMILCAVCGKTSQIDVEN